MVTLSIFNTVEFYVIAAFVAAAAIAAAAKPRAKGPARTFLVGGSLEEGCESAAAGIEMEVDDHARLRIALLWPWRASMSPSRNGLCRDGAGRLRPVPARPYSTFWDASAITSRIVRRHQAQAVLSV